MSWLSKIKPNLLLISILLFTIVIVDMAISGDMQIGLIAVGGLLSIIALFEEKCKCRPHD